MDKTELPKTVIAARPSSLIQECYKQGHLLFECPTVQCRYCHKIGHIVYNCPTKPPKPSQSGILPRPGNHSVVVAAAKESLSAPSLSSVLVSELGPLVFFMVKQFLTTSGKVSSTVSGSSNESGTSQQNGRAKHKHRHILDFVRAFLLSTSCPERFLVEAVLTVIYTINRLPFSILQNVSPFEHLYGTPPSYSSLRNFGCACFVLLQPHEYSKLEPQSRLCYFLRYGIEHKGYHCWDPISQRLRISHHVVFWEHTTFNSLSKFKTCSTPSFFTNPSLPLFPYASSLDPSPILPIPPANSPVSPLAPPLTMDLILDQTPYLPPAAPIAPPPTVDPQAMIEELQALEKTHTWDLVDLPRGKSVIGCKWVYKIKNKSDGTIEEYKARLAPPGYSDYPDKVFLFRRALYSLKQAPRAWFAKFSSIVHQFSFSSSPYDTTLVIRRSNKGMILLLLYVDDMIITGDDHSGISDFKQFLHQHFEMKDLGHLDYFLGLEVSSDSIGYYLSQANDATLYRQLVGSLVYLSITRPDIAHVVHLVSQFLVAPHSTHYAAVIHILRYIKGTIFHGLHFSAHSTLDLCAYSDADWAKDLTDHRSTTGFCFFLGDSLIFWNSKKQHIVSRSSTKAEYRALADTTSELLALHSLLEDIGLTHFSPTVIHCDNRNAIQIAHNDVFHECTRHIEIDCHLMRHHLSVGILRFLPVSSSDQTADIFTKTFPPGRFRDLVFKFKMASVKPP
uniref:CCHC-type domain-containing protein n=1 Tax=Fagus sylvatica TaxID=28930 RepID=A0A2N9IQN3_FAGSY